jgi:ATP-binding cassette, subfamily G (WHITE), member 2, SNQ2
VRCLAIGYSVLSSLSSSLLATNSSARLVRDGFKGRVPHTPAEFASTFLASAIGAENRRDIDAYRNEFVGKPERALAYKESARAEHATTLRKGSAYTISIPMQAGAVMIRRVQILRGTMATQLIILMWVLLSSQ